MTYAPGFYYAFKHPMGGEPAIPETIVRVTEDGRIIDTHNLFSTADYFEILGPVPTLDELESLGDACGDAERGAA